MDYKKQAAILSLFYFFHFGTLGIFLPFIPLYLKHSHFSGKEIGLFLSIIPIVKFLFTNRWVNFFNNLRHKNIFFITALIISNFSVILLMKSDYIFTALSFIIYALARVGVLPIIDHISNEFSKISNIEYGTLRLAGSVGFIFFTTISGWLIDNISLNFLLIAHMISGFFAAIFAKFIDFQNIKKFKKSFINIKLGLDFKIILFVCILHNISMIGFYNFFNIKISMLGKGQTLAGVIWSIGIVAEICFMFFSKNLFKVATPINILIISIFSGGLRSIVIGLSNSPILLLFINVLHGLAFGTFHLSILKYIRENLTDELRLKAQSLYSAYVYGFATITGSIVSGYLFDIFGIDKMFLILSFFNFVGIATLLLYRNRFLIK